MHVREALLAVPLELSVKAGCCLADFCARVFISSSPASWGAALRACGFMYNCHLKPLSLGGPRSQGGQWKPKLEFIWVENVELMKTSFVYTSGFPLSLSFLASLYSLLSWQLITHLESFFFFPLEFLVVFQQEGQWRHLVLEAVETEVG